ncbi:tripartite tricarboxylate transporter TctB family protein [Thermanaeromonas sp.]|uniref:tripartite tricarboxylate transporter TctB family protein n=1 Tax=Thermanaeromonas sp. TaxID=2003697 RepID=UPI00343293D1
MRTIKLNDRFLLALACGLIAAITLWDVSKFEGYGEIAKGIMGPDFFPRILSYGLLFCSLWLTYTGFRNRKEIEVSTFSFKSESVIFLCALMAYYFLMPVLGYFVTSTLFVAFTMALFGVKTKTAFPTAVVLVAMIYYLFHSLLKVQFPQGILF